ncbi:type IV secretory system conjugative DNA transfer VirD4/TraG family protein [Mucilaginibacter gracilis]|uniref:Type IV secretory system conjugative DNA transfer VirD4/TraG family protein n=1 Tax=Mucilaginibacter gracilis TaxID=423350 RepID=A0A495ITR9_9SPHI|nr:conjugal transfer protein MobC [Mucilaginibacter gracilis]RKR80060.1 type IV secretory system conjugative DNA transfer VirD4/TraG family protein [Mucilaginibacter gracilis]
MNTGEDTQGLRKIIDFTRLISIFILAIHFYIACFTAFQQWHFTADITTRIISNIAKTGLFNNIWKPKVAALLMLLISLVGAKGKKEEKIDKRAIVAYLLSGLLLYFISQLALYLSAPPTLIAFIYMAITAIGYLLILTGGTLLSRLIKIGLQDDIFNIENETFPQEGRLLENEYSVNLPATYNLKGKQHQSWINIINPFRGTLVTGTPGSGKSYFVIRHIITQHIKKGFTMFVYDFKFDDLTKIAYNTLLNHREGYKIAPKFYVINFDDLSRTHRCNPLDPQSMLDVTDASEAATTIMLGLNREWIKKQGDFFVESPINFVTAIIWYLRKYRDGRYCTLPHVIELMQADYDPLFAVLQEEEEIKVLINPFLSAFRQGAKEQLEGQIASAKISLARLSSPHLYYVLSGNDFTLDINNPAAPKIVCIGNNPQKTQIYGAVLSLFVNRLLKLNNKKNMLKSSLVFDEFSSIFVNGIDTHIAVARGYLSATTLGLQDLSQLKKDYGRDQADVIMNIVGNVISGQVTGDTAKQYSERLGKIMQDRTSINISSEDTSVNKSKQLDYAVPASKIATLSSGQFVGMVADDPDNKIALKIFHNEIQNDHVALKKEEDNYKPIPVVKQVSAEEIQETYAKVKEDINNLLFTELAMIKARNEAEAEMGGASAVNQAKEILNQKIEEKGNQQSVSM